VAQRAWAVGLGGRLVEASRTKGRVVDLADLHNPAENADPTVWWDGRVVGGGGQGRDGEIVFRLLEDIGGRRPCGRVGGSSTGDVAR
jgi:hypothetical protein